jgi:UDP-N-acetyl-D-glucosamine dehydrogenase
MYMGYMAKLLKKIDESTVKVGVVGLGYVGKPLIEAFLCKGIKVIGVDIDLKKTQGKIFPATTDYSWLKEADVIIICVPTGLNSKGEPDLKPLIAASESISKIHKPGQLIILESSTYPGTTEDILVPWMEMEGYTLGEDIFIGYSPERVDPSRNDHDVTTMPKVVSGLTSKCLTLTDDLYSIITKTHRVKNIKTAEMAKMLENTFRLVNISLVNELKLFTQRIGIDMHEVVEATATRPFGYTPFYPSAGAGGHCVPVDPAYLLYLAKQKKYPLESVKWALEVNAYMPIHVIKTLLVALKEQGKVIDGSKILILGITYKPETTDIRNSIGTQLMPMLKNGGADVRWSDSLVTQEDACNIENEGFMSSSVRLISTLQNHDATIILTDHKYDVRRLIKYCPILIDTCNATKGIKGDNIYHA